ncbi:hypothetical protein ILUMI_26211 [Ignelater luminosus]|uniref:CCHC-type domain-containing protein n=1 Tax=Ignelater luminosus TaxID=2038154 RepID=A0A8K0C722_IGNLU|nr:hypothetical protein ILUMI_26211 [Ignelater luminosus]
MRKQKDLDKLKLAITTSNSLKCQEIKKRNPRLLLPRIDIDIKKDKLLDVITENNEWLIEKCGGEEYFRNNFTEKFIFGKNENSENIVVEVNGKIRKILLENRINSIWQSIWAKDYLSIQQCYKCFGYGHTQHTCRETKHYCGKCGSTEHKFKECKSITCKCIVCIRRNSKLEGNNILHIDHDVRSNNCLSKHNIKEIMLKNIDYGEY